MKLLFEMDEKNYSDDMPLVERIGVRALIRKGNLWAMQHADGGEYKIPGGGKEGDESDLETLRREVLEETGMVIIDEKVREIGEVLEKRIDCFDPSKRYIARSRFYFCEVRDEMHELKLTASEIAKGYRLAWADLDTIIATNRQAGDERWLKRDTGFLEWLRDNLDRL